MKLAAQVFLGLMGLAFCKVGIETFIDPQSVLSAVDIELTNSSAYSSMRAVYGGLHLVFDLFCFYGIRKDQKAPLTLLLLYTSGFVLGRLSGWIVEGTPNTFVVTWLITETISGLLAAVFLYALQRKSVAPPRTALA